LSEFNKALCRVFQSQFWNVYVGHVYFNFSLGGIFDQFEFPLQLPLFVEFFLQRLLLTVLLQSKSSLLQINNFIATFSSWSKTCFICCKLNGIFLFLEEKQFGSLLKYFTAIILPSAWLTFHGA